ncbi:MAG: PAS domain S-box protein [Paracoccaceae bacterium]|nr:PAS domain S-box protein [Paracoccaceae bacterium]
MEHSLQRLSLVDVPETEDFDRFTRLATKMLGVPVALVSIVDFDEDRQFFTSACGLADPWASARQTPLSHSFCQHVVSNDKPLIIEDARVHPLVHDNPAIDDLNVIAYLGIPIAAPDGTCLGALCAIDSKPRMWSREDVCVLTDLAASVTSQIGLSAALLISESRRKAATRFGNIVENAHHEVFTFDPETLLFTGVNKGARENLGYNQPEIRRLTPLDIIPDYDRFAFEDLLRPLRQGRISKLEFKTRHQRKDATTYPVSIRLELQQEAGEPVFIAFCIDITERLQLQRALREKSESFSALFKHAHEPMTIANIDTTLLQVNPACQELFGHSSEALVGTRFMNHVPQEYQADIARKLSDATPESPFFSSFQQQDVNGQHKIMHWSNIVQFVNGKATKVFSIANDVTELHAAKTRAEVSAQEARKAIEIRKVFLANMSHEVRTPLNAIMGLFQLIQMADVPERQKKQAEVGLDASHHLLAQLVNVLELSRVEANAVEITATPTEVRPLAAQWLETATATNHRLGKPIELALEVDEATPEFAMLDARRVTQILNNLTDNAIKFTTKGRVTIQVSMVPAKDPAGPAQLEISVSDTGCGIPTDKRDAVFERFFQIDDAQTRENSGSGLGLAISRELAMLMGATLEVASPAPDGCYTTTFALRLSSVD